MTENQKYALHLDMLRQYNKMTVQEFCSDIVDERTYRRYKTGEKTISYTKIAAFCERLRMNTADFFYSAKYDDALEHKKIYQLYEYMRARNFDAYKKELAHIDLDYIFDLQNRRLYDMTVAFASYEMKDKRLDEIFNMVCDIANYPKCLSFRTFDAISISALVKIAEIEIKKNKEDALKLLMEILSDPSMLMATAENHRTIPVIYSDVSIFLLRLHRFKAANYIAGNGIKYALNHHDYLSISHLYYAKSYALLMLNDRENAEINAVRCLTSAVGRESDYQIELFYRVLKKDFQEDPYTFIDKHLKTMIEEASERQQKIPK